MTIKRLVVIALLLVPMAAWSFAKPVRVLAPQLVGLSCYSDGICVDDPARLTEARALYRDALRFVESNVGAVERAPRAVFCASKSCSGRFGLHGGGYSHAAAYNVGTFGLVVGYRGWQPHYLRHELIHHLQNERLGSLNAWFRKPDWFKEGMAYSLSDDPRQPLPEALERYRRRYDAWAVGLRGESVWEGAARL